MEINQLINQSFTTSGSKAHQTEINHKQKTQKKTTERMNEKE